MLEIIVAVLAISAMVKIASADNQSGLVWGFITFILCVACILLIQLPFLRIGIAGILAFLGMIGYKVATNG